MGAGRRDRCCCQANTVPGRAESDQQRSYGVCVAHHDPLALGAGVVAVPTGDHRGW